MAGFSSKGQLQRHSSLVRQGAGGVRRRGQAAMRRRSSGCGRA
uniref:Uncharacterized protein n=1 Tax=Arundo donax TaxID=35708 RepID=A0A0A8YUP8_ARUDO